MRRTGTSKRAREFRCIVPEHSQVNEQVTCILEGALKFWINGKEIVVSAGEVLTIPNMPHKAEALVDTVDLDVFSPPRADWINKTERISAQQLIRVNSTRRMNPHDDPIDKSCSSISWRQRQRSNFENVHKTH